MPLPDPPSLLISGPAASGKSRAALERFRAASGSLLITPTATMAEHLRHEMARAGEPIRPSRVTTISKLLDQCTALAAPPPHLAHVLIEEALDQLRPARFRNVWQFEGLHAAMAELFEEAPAEALPADLAALLSHVEKELLARSMGFRRKRLAEADWRALGPLPAVVFDGFFTFSDYETRALIELSRNTRVVLTLPDWPFDRARERLLRAGFAEQRLASSHRAAKQTAFAAPTIEREAEEIAGRILEAHSSGRAFREIGIVLRSPEPYASLLATTLARFGIPARSYFPDSLGQHPAVQFLMGIVRSAAAGWDHTALLDALRMPVSGIGATPEGDRMDFEWRLRIPGRGSALPGPLPDNCGFAVDLERGQATAKVWAARFKALRSHVTLPNIEDGASRMEVAAWRSTAAALEAFDQAVDQAAEVLGAGQIPLGSFSNLLRRAVALAPLRVADRRRDVVHVMDVFEARQWELPVVFVCGLTERHFPRYHREDPLLGDAGRRNAGLETAAERQAQERALFDFAISRASEHVVLSYPRFDEKGEDTLRSFFLDRAAEHAGRTVRPRARRVTRPPAISEAPQKKTLAVLHRKLSPSSIETFAQCPFKFFASRTLRLRERPPEPRDRLDVRLQGSIMHKALAEWVHNPLLGVAIFDRIFDEECEKYRVLQGYRTEAMRLEMARNFAALIADPEAQPAGWQTKAEQDFEFQLFPGLAIRGRIDRLETNARGEALVIDYKYSAAQKIREHVENSELGQKVQAGLYLLAAERQFKLKPIGMKFCGMRKEVSWGGWVVPDVSADELRDLINTAERVAAAAHERILGGNMAVHPANPDDCRFCDYRDACRVGSAAIVRGAGS